MSAQMWWSQVMAGLSVRPGEWSPVDFYRMLEAYYLNNGLYDGAQQALYENGIWTPGMKPLRNPCRRCVEFHVTHIWPGSYDRALPIETENARIIPALHQVWDWSNWSVKKQLAARWFALFGDWFCKVSTTGTGGKVERVFLQNIKPENVTDFETDERGNVIYIRIDIPIAGESRDMPALHTEIWEKTRGLKVYQHRREQGARVESLGRPVLSRSLDEFGIDFVPFVQAPFIDLGNKRGAGVFALALDKIDEANRMATRLHQMIFRYNKPTVAIMANGVDDAGRPMSPPKFSDQTSHADWPGKAGEGDDDIKSFPGMSHMEFLVPNLNYGAHLDAINAQMRELEEDLPELSYYRQRELGASISGKAVRLLLAQALDRTLEARGNIESALVKADMMALTIGANAGIFKRIGAYEKGDFVHRFAEREVLKSNDESPNDMGTV